MINLAKIELMQKCLEYVPDFKEWVEKKEGTGHKEFFDRWVAPSDPNVVEVDCMNTEKVDTAFIGVNVRYVKQEQCAILKIWVDASDKSPFYDLSLNLYFAFDSEHMDFKFESRIVP